jgi:hypothetical protein
MALYIFDKSYSRMHSARVIPIAKLSLLNCILEDGVSLFYMHLNIASLKNIFSFASHLLLKLFSHIQEC